MAMKIEPEEVKDNKDQIPKDPQEKIYYSINERLMLGGYIPQQTERDGQGNIIGIHGDQAIQFEGHFYRTSNSDEQKFIERCEEFGKEKFNAIREVTEKEAEQIDVDMAERRRIAQEQAVGR